MSFEMSNTNSLANPTLTWMGTLIAMAWLVAYVTPAFRRRMMDRALYFLLDLLLIVSLWWVARQSTGTGNFWTLMAAGWTSNLVGNTIWGVYNMRANKKLPTLSPVDVLYVARYILVLVAFWLYPTTMPTWQWASMIGFTLVIAAATWPRLFRPISKSTKDPLHYLLGRAIYPILDITIVCAAILSWTRAATNDWRAITGLFIIGLAAYGVANWLNFRDRAASLAVLKNRAAFFWPLAAIFAGLATLCATRN